MLQRGSVERRPTETITKQLVGRDSVEPERIGGLRIHFRLNTGSQELAPPCTSRGAPRTMLLSEVEMSLTIPSLAKKIGDSSRPSHKATARQATILGMKDRRTRAMHFFKPKLIECLRDYERRTFFCDLAAGVTVG